MKTERPPNNPETVPRRTWAWSGAQDGWAEFQGPGLKALVEVLPVSWVHCGTESSLASRQGRARCLADETAVSRHQCKATLVS